MLPGKKLPGHYGDARRTVQSLKVVRVDAARGLLLVRGSVPGADGGYLIIRKAVARKPEPQVQVEKSAKKTVSKAKK